MPSLIGLDFISDPHKLCGTAGPNWYDGHVLPGLDDPDPAAFQPHGLYVHVPFCASKCGYCDFYSVAVKEHDTAGLVMRIGRELGIRLRDSPGNLRTVFIGGGTPTVLRPNQLISLLDAVSRTARVDRITEFTVEANPDTIDDDKVKLLVQGGVTRVSMGVQSFFVRELATLERLHAPDDIAPSVEMLRRCDIRQINLDLIFGIPGQTLDTWLQSLTRAIELEPDHMACYGLTYESGTRLTAMRRAGRITPCDEQLEADMYLCAIDTLSEVGFEQYETSNFARPGCMCRHNLIYWRNEPYIGVGPSAAGYVDGRRYKNIVDIDDYIRMMDTQGHAEAESEIVDTHMLMTEMIMMQLRLVEGLSFESFRKRTGVDPLALFGDVLDRLVDLGFVTVSDTHIALTRPGRLISDAVMAELVSAYVGQKPRLSTTPTTRWLGRASPDISKKVAQKCRIP